MKKAYQDWIDTVSSVMSDVDGWCERITKLMQKHFTELERVRGHVVFPGCPKIGGIGVPHWWLKDGEEIIDPTAKQFSPYQFTLKYLEHTGPEPKGKCRCCGNYVYTNNVCCSDECFKAYTKHVFGD